MSLSKIVFCIVLVLSIFIGVLYYKSHTNDSGVKWSQTTPKIAINDSNMAPITEPTLSRMDRVSSETVACDRGGFVVLEYPYFVSTKAIKWYFDGYSKKEIAEFLAKNFDLRTATNWVKSVESISKYSANHADLISYIDSIEIEGDEEQSVGHVDKLRTFQNISYEEGNVSSLINLYPDLSNRIRLEEFENAMREGNHSRIYDAINNMKKFMEPTWYFDHPLLKPEVLLIISTLEYEVATNIVLALFEIAPVYYIEKEEIDTLLSVLEGLEVKVSDANIIRFDKYQLQHNDRIEALVSELQDEQNLVKSSSANCIVALPDQEHSTLKPNRTLSQVSEKWEGVYRTVCPDDSIYTNLAILNDKLRNNLFDVDLFNNSHHLSEYIDTMEKAVQDLEEDEKRLFFYKFFLEKEFNKNEIEQLIARNLVPEDSDLYLLISHLPSGEQKELIMKNRERFERANNSGFSIVSLAILNGQPEMVPFLTSNYFTLKDKENSPDPLWIQLYLLSLGNDLEPSIKNNIGNLIGESDIDETHSDIMHRIRESNIDLYNEIVQDFPTLLREPPAQKLDFLCD